MKSEAQINDAIKKINSNSELLYGYKEDITAALEWTLGKGEIDRL